MAYPGNTPANPTNPDKIPAMHPDAQDEGQDSRAVAHDGQDEFKIAKMTPKMAKMRRNMAKIRLKMARMRPKMAKMRPKMTKMRPKMAKMRPKMAKMGPKMAKSTRAGARGHRGKGFFFTSKMSGFRT